MIVSKSRTARHLKSLIAQRDVEVDYLKDIVILYAPTYGQAVAEPVVEANEEQGRHVRFDLQTESHASGSESEPTGELLGEIESQRSGSASEYQADDPNDSLSFVERASPAESMIQCHQSARPGPRSRTNRSRLLLSRLTLPVRPDLAAVGVLAVIRCGYWCVTTRITASAISLSQLLTRVTMTGCPRT
ncbi:hypothetical protein CYMTET_31871 [Cymbomonas tetramitiformis]|uniref:Uncharacterized protein n=1 Tax=Cymbomonas tetramitiformis TaxID=36881 RepID=A0AAE0FG56_9CHLO|nr:hypothetical protein CYMTET_31871 [Cymbomonas tetramitiformis]